MLEKTTAPLIPPPGLRPPPGLPPPPKPQSMEVEPTERPLKDVEMEEQTEEGDQKRSRILSINHV